MLTHDVVVLGGGPAGSVTAKRLAAAGVRVALVGAVSRPGWEGLSVRSHALLEDEDLGCHAACIDGPLTRRGNWAGRAVEGVEWLVERSRLAEALRSQAQSAGAHCRSDRVAALVRFGGRWRVSLRSGRSLEAPIVIDARGRRGAERRGPLLLAIGQRFRRERPDAPGTQIHATDFGWCWWAEQGSTLWLQIVGRPLSKALRPPATRLRGQLMRGSAQRGTIQCCGASATLPWRLIPCPARGCMRRCAGRSSWRHRFARSSPAGVHRSRIASSPSGTRSPGSAVFASPPTSIVKTPAAADSAQKLPWPTPRCCPMSRDSSPASSGGR